MAAMTTTNAALGDAQIVGNDEGKVTLSRSWKVVRSHESSYRGGKAMLSADGRFMACWESDRIKFLDIGSGQIIKVIETGEDDHITTFTMSPNQKVLYTAHGRTLSVKQWNIATGEMIRSWRGHELPILEMAVDPTGQLVATASVDRSVRVWDAQGGFCTHNLTDHTAMVTKVYLFYRDVKMPVTSSAEESKSKSTKSKKSTGSQSQQQWQTVKVHQALACAEGGEVKLWTLGAGGRASTSITLKNHLSTVTSAVLMEDNNTLVTAGRDSVMSAWNLDVINPSADETLFNPVQLEELYPDVARHPRFNAKLLQSAIPVFEGIEGLVGLKSGLEIPQVQGVLRSNSKTLRVPSATEDMWVLAAGDKGMLRVWSIVNRRAISTLILGAVARKLAAIGSKSTGPVTQDTDDYSAAVKGLSVDTKLVQSSDANLSKSAKKAKAQADAEAKTQAEASSFPLPTEPAPPQFALSNLFLYLPAVSTKTVEDDNSDDEAEQDNLLLPSQRDPTAHLSEAVYSGVDHDRLGELGIIIPDEIKEQQKEEKAKVIREHKKAQRQAARDARRQAKLATLHDMDEDDEDGSEQSDEEGDGVDTLSDDDEDVTPDTTEHVYVPKVPFSTASVVTLTGEQNMVTFSLKTMKQDKLLVGFNDDVVDIKPIPHSTYVAVATNSSQIRIFNTQDMSAVLLSAHSDIVVAIDVSPCGRWLASCSKDKTVRIWLLPAHYSVPTRQAAEEMKKYADTQKTPVHPAFTIQDPVLVATGLGHTEAVTSVAFSRRLLPHPHEPCPAGGISHFFVVSGSSDRTLKHWNLLPLLALGGYDFIDGSKGTGHVSKEAKLEYTEMGSPVLQKFLDGLATPVTLRALHTVLGHEKDINALAISRDDRFMASASQDRTIKIWNPDTLKVIAVMRGHKRSIWSVTFSPIEKMLASTSSDKTIKLWSLNDFSCVKTLEGHTSAVVKAAFIKSGTQLFSSDAEGTIKLWNVSESECINTLSETHTDRVWGLAVLSLPEPDGAVARRLRRRGYNVVPPLHIVTGGSDSTIAIWRDVTLEEDASKAREEYMRGLKEQALTNAMRKKDFAESFSLALSLNQPRRVYAVLSDLNDAETRYKRWRHLDRVRAKLQEERTARRKAARERAARSGKANTGDTAGDHSDDDEDDDPYLSIEAREDLLLIVPKPSATMISLVKSLSIPDLAKLLKYIQDWNANSKYASVAQRMLNAILTHLSPAVLKQVRNIKDIVAAIAAYSQRHFVRVDTLLRKSYMIDYTLQSSTLVLPVVDMGTEAVAETDANVTPSAKVSKAMRGKTRAERMLHALSLAVDGSDLEDEIISEDDAEDVLAEDQLSDDELVVEEELAQAEEEETKNRMDLSIFSRQDDNEDEDEQDVQPEPKLGSKRVRNESGPSESEVQAALKRIASRPAADGSRILVSKSVDQDDGSQEDSEPIEGFTAAMFDTNWSSDESDENSDEASTGSEEESDEEVVIPTKKSSASAVGSKPKQASSIMSNAKKPARLQQPEVNSKKKPAQAVVAKSASTLKSSTDLSLGKKRKGAK